jgi:isoleucyl-tRNA synthetase
LLANISDFDATQDALPLEQLLECDRYALARAAQLQAEILAHYQVYEFHPVVSKLQNYCSEDLGAFYLDVLKDRLYTTAPKSAARRSAQTALWHITQSMLRWMAPFLSFTAEEAWPLLGKGSVFAQTFWNLPAPDEALITKWSRILAVRAEVNRSLETVRGQGAIGASLQATVRLTAGAEDHAALASLGDDLKFILIVSDVSLLAGDALAIEVLPSTAAKCERCWHYRDDVGRNPAHPRICGRCDDNLHGAGETRSFA